MRTVEILMVIVVLFVAFAATSYFAVLPSPRLVSGTNLRELAISTMETFDVGGDLSRIAFSNPSDPSWTSLQIALASSLPPNVVYNLTVYDILTSSEGVVTYRLVRSISNSQSDLGVGSDASSHIVTSSNVKYTVTPQKIGESVGKNTTLYILNCNDANGWWITGYTGQSLASDIHNLLSPYFENAILVNSTDQLGLLLDGTPLVGEDIEDAVIINTFGEAVPIPSGYADDYPAGSYAEYCYVLGQRVNQYNWTFASIVGYPLYYVTNTVKFADSDNTWGIYGMKHVGPAGLNAFLRGIDNQGYSYDSGWITGEIGVVEFTSDTRDLSNYYGIYPAPYQTASRALPQSIENNYDLTRRATMFEPKSGYIGAATFSHNGGGALTAVGLTRIPDIRIVVLDLLMYYRPALYRSEFGASGTSRLIVLQLAQQGGA